MKIPAAGYTSPEAIRIAEAASTEFSQITTLVRDALAQSLGVERWNITLVAIHPDRAVVMKDGRFWSYPYTIGADNTVQLGQGAEVTQQWQPVREAADPLNLRDKLARALRGAECAFVEAKDAEGRTWEVRVIRSGTSKNGNYYPDTALREAAPMFEGVKVFAKADAEHLAGRGKDVRNLVGWLEQPRFVEGDASDTGEIRATLQLTESAPIRQPLVDAWKRGKHDLMALSIDASARTQKRTQGGKTFREATQFTRIHSVDVIVEPGAGGGFLRLVEAHQENDPMRERLIAKIKQAPKTAAKIADVDALTDEQLEEHYAEAVAELAAKSEPKADPAPKAEDINARVTEAVALVTQRAEARVAIQAASLPQAAKDRLVVRFAEAADCTPETVKAAIEDERKYLAQFTESDRVSLQFDEGARNTEPRSKVIAKMLDDYFEGGKGVASIKECYIEITGDRRITGRLENCDRTRLREAASTEERVVESVDSTTFANVLGSSIARRVAAEYANLVMYDSWRRIVNVVSVSDFRTQEITRMGGYGSLPSVAQGGAYNALTSPSDEKATYTLGKYGGTEDITLEAIANDDQRVIQRIPQRMAFAAKRTLYEFVFDFIRTNPTLYDSVAFFHASHGNLGSSALDATTWAAARLAMMKQTEAGSSKRLGIPPGFLLVPPDLEETGFNLFVRTTNNDKNFVQAQSVDVIPVIYWTDANDWAAVANPRELPSIEIGFYNGMEDPEIFVQDMPTVGSMFSNDKLTWKIRHIYSGQVHNYRGAYKAVVA
ncbi:MAG: hypothetical protein GC151_13905 [Betaproteobacteria bacterium]|nr:hypothetical protein [Betaproteobacteria bacterium]